MSNAVNDEWARQPADPDPERDLNYRLVDWMSIPASQHGRDYTMFIPEEEEMLRDDEFIVIEEDDVCDLIDHV